MSLWNTAAMRRLGKILAVIFTLAALLVTAAYFVITSDWAKSRVRTLVEEEITRATGGRAEIASLDYDLRSLHFEVEGFALHGTEGTEEAALFRASRISVDATILSFLAKKVTVDSVTVDHPAFHLHLYEDGRTNLPNPPGPSSGKPFTSTLVDLGIGHFEARNGIATLAEQSIPLDVRGDNLEVTLDFERAAERYRGEIAAQRLQFSTDRIQPVPFDFRAGVVLDREGIRLDKGTLAYGKSTVDFSASIDQFENPRISIPFTGHLQVSDFHKAFGLPIESTGNVHAEGEFRYHDKIWELTGDARGSGLAVRSGAVRIDNIGLRTKLALEKDSFVFTNLSASALGGEVRGQASFRDGRRLTVKAQANNLSLDRVSRASGVGPLAFHSRVNGPIEISATVDAKGVHDLVAAARLALTPTEGENPLSGTVDASFHQRDRSISFRESRLELAHSFVSVSGRIRDSIDVAVRTTHFEDFLPALGLVSEKPESLIPIQLGQNGMAQFAGTLRGDWSNPVLVGEFSGKSIQYEKRSLDSIAGQIETGQSKLRVGNLVARKGDAEVRGSLALPLREWELDRSGALSAALTLNASGIEGLLSEAGEKGLDLHGRPNAEVVVQGSLDAPEATLRASLRNGSIYGEPFDVVTLNAGYAGNALNVTESSLVRGSAVAHLKGSYRHEDGDYQTGQGSLSLALKGWKLNDLTAIRQQNIAAEAKIAGEATVGFELRKGTLAVRAVDGGVEAADVQFEGKTAGRFSLSAKSDGGEVDVALRGSLVGSTIEGNARVGLQGDYPAKAQIALENLSLDAIRPFLPDSLDRRSLPLEANLASTITLDGPLAKPNQFRGELTVSRLRVATAAPESQSLVKRTPFELKNARPLRLAWDGRRLTAQDVALEGTGTKLTVSGGITPSNPRQQLDLQAKGSLNFNIFNAFEPSIDAGGKSDLDLTVRGTFKAPDVYGLLDLSDASLYLAGVPNGLDKINGRVFLYRDRANIEEIRAESGGGALSLTGFVSYSEGIPAFRLSARVKDVRVRYPPGVSTSADAELELTGSRNQSILSGNVTITRVALNPRSDLGSILTSTSKPVATPSANQNDFLRNMRFDVQVQTAPDVRFDSSLTQDLAGEANLRLRGNPYTPVLLGTVTVNQGEVNFFGNRYFIDRGEISFLNPLKMEPVLNLDLRTRVRSIDVTLTFSGPLDKLNINYRSDPPLQLNEIIALLTVGRAPAGSPSLAEAQSEAAQSWQQIGASALVGQAVAAPIAGRLQKLFGVSRIKIDPRVTGVENNPQARLTVEQQVNRDITITFITNLADAQQQIVRLEWNFNTDWSMVALRDEDGLFGVDFLFRKRF